MRDPDISPARALRRVARSAPSTPSLVYGDRTWTAAELDAATARLAGALRLGGVAAGERVGYLGLNSAALLQTFLACARLGAIFVPVNFRLATAEVRYVLSDADLHTAVVEEGHRAVADAVADAVGVKQWLLVDDDPAVPVPDDAVLDARWTLLSAALGAVPEALPETLADEPVPLTWDDIAVLMYTSGTTGRPKGVVLTHGNVWWNNANVRTVIDCRLDDVVLGVAPMFHIGGLNVFTVDALTTGGTVVVLRTFDPVAVLDAIARHRVTSAFGVPAMFAALERAPGFAEADLSTLRSVVVAGAPVPVGLITRYHERGIDLQQAWGLTETAPFATHLPARLIESKLGSAGIAMPYTQVRLCHPGTTQVITEPGQRGEVCVTGPNVTGGYWRNPDATAAAFDAEGWFRSGDIGELDDDGFLRVVDRVKDMIISGGENVYPAEVERVLVTLPGVLDVAVVGLPDERWGETVVAMLACEPGVEPTVEQVRAFAGQHLARYKLPTHVWVVPNLPRNGSGKLDKVALRRRSSDLLAHETGPA